jgi:aminoglycoside phosphotransferase (APT) family kinase protein
MRFTLPPASLSENQIAHILSRALPQHALQSFEPLTGGSINAMYRLRAEGLQEALVLRVYSRDPSACQKEVDLHQLVSGQVPVPEIVYANPWANPQEEAGVGPHILMRWIEGQTFREIKSRRDPREIAEAAHSIGVTLARIGSFQFPHAGRIGPGLEIGGPLENGPDPVPTFIESCLESPEMARRLDERHRQRLRGFIWDWAKQLAALSEERSLVHSDYGSPNILLNRLLNPVNGRWKVAAVLDWEFAFAGSPLYDVGHILRYDRRTPPLMEPHLAAGFREGGGALPENWRSLARALDLTALCDVLTRPDLPEGVVADLVELIVGTMDFAPRNLESSSHSH